MAYRSYLRSVLNDNFKILTWVLILFIAIMPNFIFMKSANAANAANPSIGGWKVNQTTDFGIGKKITATKTAMINGAEVVKTSTAAVIPKANNIAKFLAKNAAMAVAIGALDYILDGVDYVLDPANNSITYMQKSSDLSLTSPYIYKVSSYGTGYDESTAVMGYFNWLVNNNNGFRNAVFISMEPCTSCTGGGTWYDRDRYKYISVSYGGYSEVRVSSFLIERVSNPSYNPTSQDEEKIVPLSDVATQVADKAVEDERRGVISPAVVAARTAAGEMIGEASDDRLAPPIVGNPSTPKDIAKELDKAAVVPSNPAAEGTISTPAVVDPVTGEVKTPAQTSDIALDFPLVCEWAPILCEAAQTAINFMNDFEPDAESGEVTIHEDNNIIFDDSQRFNFSSSCPSPEQFSVSFFGATQDLEFSYQPLCDFMSMIKPFVVAGSYVIGAYIVMGLSRGSAD